MAVFTSEEIIQATGARLLKPAAPVSFSEVCTDTRAIAKGSLFVAFKGTSFNGPRLRRQSLGSRRCRCCRIGSTPGI